MCAEDERVESAAGGLRASGADVRAVQGPGPTETEFFHRAGLDDTTMGAAGKDDPARVAEQGFDALMSGERTVVAGSLSTTASSVANAVPPDAVKGRMHRSVAEPGSAEQ